MDNHSTNVIVVKKKNEHCYNIYNNSTMNFTELKGIGEEKLTHMF